MFQYLLQKTPHDLIFNQVIYLDFKFHIIFKKLKNSTQHSFEGKRLYNKEVKKSQKDASITFDVTTETVKKQKNEALHQIL